MLTEESLRSSPFGIRCYVYILRSCFVALGKLSPRLAGRVALNVFLRPPRIRASKWEREFAEKGVPHNLYIGEKKIRLLEHGKGDKKALLVHGWGSRGTHLGSFAIALMHEGYTVYSLDGPAHGESSGKTTDMFDFAESIVEANRFIGNADTVISHSFGAGCTLLATAKLGLPKSNLILISCFSDAIYITEQFAKFFRISQSSIEQMRLHLQNKFKNSWTWQSLAPERLIADVPGSVLIIHDSDDLEVPIDHAILLARRSRDSRLHSTSKQGHRKILRDRSAVDAAVKFLRDCG
ncbi:alpha/beta hydrolase [Achromobacter sp. AGC39]